MTEYKVTKMAKVSISSPSGEGGETFISIGGGGGKKFPLVLLQAKAVRLVLSQYEDARFFKGFH